MMTFQNRPRTKPPTLKFSPYSWAKLLYLRDLGDTEVGGFGISSRDDLLRIDEVQLVRQTCTAVTVEFEDESVADFFDRQVDAGRRPEEFGRLWLHTHPGDSALPSNTDEETFARVFGSCQWAVMFILAQQGQTYARLQFNVGPGSSQELAVEIDYSQPFAGVDADAWDEEYLANVQLQSWNQTQWCDETFTKLTDDTPQAWRDAWHAYSDEEFQKEFGYE